MRQRILLYTDIATMRGALHVLVLRALTYIYPLYLTQNLFTEIGNRVTILAAE